MGQGICDILQMWMAIIVWQCANWKALFLGIFGVLIVPMRNWNKWTSLTIYGRNRVLIVPMRNWNFGGTSVLAESTCFDRTYEELKPGPRHHHDAVAVVGFDRTYEELKLAYMIGNICSGSFWSYLWGIETWLRPPCHRCFAPGFDRTYEELKLRYDESAPCVTGAFWSYLWGIETVPSDRDRRHRPARFDRTYEELKLLTISFSTITPWVLIVPMRNWNLGDHSAINAFAEFWSYLWGIETMTSSPSVR